MVELTYTGQAPGLRTWTGLVTGCRYPFGQGMTRYVDKRDAQVWLNPRGDGTRVFEHDQDEGDQAGTVQV